MVQLLQTTGLKSRVCNKEASMSRTYRNRIARRKIKRKHRRPRKSSRNNIKALIKSYEEARLAELVDATDLKSVGTLSREGSSPSPGTSL